MNDNWWLYQIAYPDYQFWNTRIPRGSMFAVGIQDDYGDFLLFDIQH